MDTGGYVQFDKDILTENPTDRGKDLVEHYKEFHQVTEEASCNTIEENEEEENTPESDNTPCPLDYRDALSFTPTPLVCSRTSNSSSKTRGAAAPRTRITWRLP